MNSLIPRSFDDSELNDCLQDKLTVTVFFNGTKLETGKITMFDDYTIKLENCYSRRNILISIC